MVWASEKSYTIDHLQRYLQVRRQKVQKVLEWLHKHNCLYKNIVIDYDELHGWAAEFIPTGILENIVQCDNMHPEKEGYVADLEKGNYEDDFQVALDTGGVNRLSDSTQETINGCVYVDAENREEHPTGKFVAALQTEKQNDSNSSKTSSELEITYCRQNQAQLLNDHKDPCFFTMAFPTLFLFGIREHLLRSEKQPITVFLTAWARWIMSYHTQK